VDILILVIAAAFLLMGLSALWRPAAIGRYFDVRIESVDGRNEVRAVYGGFGLAIAFALYWGLQRPELRAGVLVCVALALAGMAVGRVFSALLERPGRWPVFFGALEAVGAGALWWAYTAFL